MTYPSILSWILLFYFLLENEQRDKKGPALFSSYVGILLDLIKSVELHHVIAENCLLLFVSQM